MQLAHIQNKIFIIRGQNVMLDFDIANLYETETRVLKQAVRRNINRFPIDFMFELINKKINDLVSQNVIPSKKKFGGAIPMAFTEQGVAMLASVLKNNKAIGVNIQIVRAFVYLRQYALTYKELADKLKKLEGKITDVSQAINYLLQKDKLQVQQQKRKKIGFKIKQL